MADVPATGAFDDLAAALGDGFAMLGGGEHRTLYEFHREWMEEVLARAAG